MAYEYDAFVKTIKVIESCKTIEQLDSAEQYITLFYDMFPLPNKQPDAVYDYIENLNDKQRKLIEHK